MNEAELAHRLSVSWWNVVSEQKRNIERRDDATKKELSLFINITPSQYPEAVSQVRAASAASSFALLRFLPSYQNFALTGVPHTLTMHDQAVRPPLLSETI